MEYKSVVANNLAAYRKSQNYTQLELSTLSGVSRSSIGYVEQSYTNVTLEILQILCDCLNIHPATLFARNCFRFSGYSKKDKKLVPANIKPGDIGLFRWGEYGLEFYSICESDMKLVLQFLNNQNNIEELSKYSVV